MNLLMLAGKAGCGKSTVVEYLRRKFGAAEVAQANPLKEFAAGAFNFSHEQLYGPSSSRNRPDGRYHNGNSPGWELARRAVEGALGSVFAETLAEVSGIETEELHRALIAWFADLKQLAQRDGQLSPRTVLQTLGTEYGRAQVADDVWIKLALSVAASEQAPLVVISDGRFANEIAAAKQAGGKAVMISAKVAANDMTGGEATHASETELDGVAKGLFDAWIVNRKTGMELLYAALDSLIPSLFPSFR